VYLVIGFLGLATYVFTAIFVYVSEKDLEHHVTGAKNNRTPGAYINASGTPPVLPPIGRASAGCAEEQEETEDDSIQLSRSVPACRNATILYTSNGRLLNAALILGQTEKHISATLHTTDIISIPHVPTMASPWLRSTVRH
jgi:hypothetical protein